MMSPTWHRLRTCWILWINNMFQRLLILLFLTCVVFWPAQALTTTAVNSAFDAARIYPNPWRADQDANVNIKFDRLPAASTIKIFTVSGHKVKTLSTDNGGMASWDRTNDDGDAVASGVY